MGAFVDHIVTTYGYYAVFGLVMLESLGIPVPGETGLILAALAASTGRLSIVIVVAVAIAAAIIGDNLGYLIGRYGGFPLLRRVQKRFRIDPRKLKIARYLFERHGAVVVFLGRFVSVLRTYSAFFAGTTRMAWARFVGANAAGGIAWASAWGFGVYALGASAKRFGTPIDIVLGVLAAAILGGLFFWSRRHEQELAQRAEKIFPDRWDGKPVRGDRATGSAQGQRSRAA